MRIIEDVHLRLVTEATETQLLPTSPKSKISINGISFKPVINGATLEACIEFNDTYLVFTTDDCPFEEGLNIYLLSQQYGIIDTAMAGVAYHTGQFKLLRIIEPNVVQFEFFPDHHWQIKLFNKKRFFIPIPSLSEPFGISRKLTLHRAFKVSELPKGQ